MMVVVCYAVLCVCYLMELIAFVKLSKTMIMCECARIFIRWTCFNETKEYICEFILVVLFMHCTVRCAYYMKSNFDIRLVGRLDFSFSVVFQFIPFRVSTIYCFASVRSQLCEFWPHKKAHHIHIHGRISMRDRCSNYHCWCFLNSDMPTHGVHTNTHTNTQTREYYYA